MIFACNTYYCAVCLMTLTILIHKFSLVLLLRCHVPWSYAKYIFPFSFPVSLHTVHISYPFTIIVRGQVYKYVAPLKKNTYKNFSGSLSLTYRIDRRLFPQATELLSAVFPFCFVSSFLRRLAQWANQHGGGQRLAAPVSMHLGKQIRGSDGCWDRFWQISNFLSNWKLLLEVVLSGASCGNWVSAAFWALAAFFSCWPLWTLGTRGWEGCQGRGWAVQQ